MQMFELNKAESCSIVLNDVADQYKNSFASSAPGLDFLHFAADEIVVASKRHPGVSEDQAEALRSLIQAIGTGRVGPCKFLVLDLASQGDEASGPPLDLAGLLDDVSDLLFEAPVIPVAWARGLVARADLEIALACSVLVGEADARFSFDIDLVSNLRSYSLLAHKLGFVQAERLMEAGTTLDATRLHDLMLLNAVVPSAAGFEGIRCFAAGRARRHNAACGIYRAQRLAMSGIGSRAV